MGNVWQCDLETEYNWSSPEPQAGFVEFSCWNPFVSISNLYHGHRISEVVGTGLVVRQSHCGLDWTDRNIFSDRCHIVMGQIGQNGGHGLVNSKRMYHETSTLIPSKEQGEHNHSARSLALGRLLI